MANSARRKEKQRLKREKKKAQLRRAQAVSPYKRIGAAGAMEACYVNSDWRERGLAAIYLLQRNPLSGYAMACFLIDTWCAGLKDAFAHLDYTREKFQRQLDHASEAWGASLTRLDLAEARRLVAASIRHAQRHGFRLPHHYERFVSMLGQLPVVDEQDLAEFGKDGKLLWVGSLDDLRRRLIGCTLEEFVARPDVQFIIDAAGAGFVRDPDDSDDEEDFDAMVEDAREIFLGRCESLAAQLREHCVRTNRVPAERLGDAARVVLGMGWLGAVAAKRRAPDDEMDANWLEACHTAVDEVLVDLLGPPQQLKDDPGMTEAMQQAYQAMQEIGAQQAAAAGELPHERPSAPGPGEDPSPPPPL